MAKQETNQREPSSNYTQLLAPGVRYLPQPALSVIFPILVSCVWNTSASLFCFRRMCRQATPYCCASGLLDLYISAPHLAQCRIQLCRHLTSSSSPASVFQCHVGGLGYHFAGSGKFIPPVLTVVTIEIMSLTGSCYFGLQVSEESWPVTRIKQIAEVKGKRQNKYILIFLLITRKWKRAPESTVNSVVLTAWSLANIQIPQWV